MIREMTKKRRTKNQKIQAKHHFTLSWSNQEKKPDSGIDVKRQFKKKVSSNIASSSKHENAMFLAKEASFKPIKNDVLKSLIIASLILALEIVIYLAWKV